MTRNHTSLPELKSIGASENLIDTNSTPLRPEITSQNSRSCFESSQKFQRDGTELVSSDRLITHSPNRSIGKLKQSWKPMEWQKFGRQQFPPQHCIKQPTSSMLSPQATQPIKLKVTPQEKHDDAASKNTIISSVTQSNKHDVSTGKSQKESNEPMRSEQVKMSLPNQNMNKSDQNWTPGKIQPSSKQPISQPIESSPSQSRPPSKLISHSLIDDASRVNITKSSVNTPNKLDVNQKHSPHHQYSNNSARNIPTKKSYYLGVGW